MWIGDRRMVGRAVTALGLVGVCAMASCSGSSGDLPPASDYKRTPEHDARLLAFTGNVLTFVLLHEMGHMMMSQYADRIDAGGKPEDGADRFAAAVMLNSAGSGIGALNDAAVFWDAMHRRDEALFRAANHRARTSNEINFGDEHGEPKQRSFHLRCLIYAEDRTAYHFDRDQARSCISMAGNNSTAWQGLIGSHLDPQAGQVGDPNAPNVAVYYSPPPDDVRRALDPDLKMTMALMSLPARQRASLTFGEAKVQELGTLDGIASQFLLLKTPTESITAAAPAGSRVNDYPLGLSSEIARQVLAPIGHGPETSLDTTPPAAVAPHIEHPTSRSFKPERYNYVVIGDNCYDREKPAIDGVNPEVNAYWQKNTRSITLCYSVLGLIDEIGRSLIVEADRAQH